MEFRTLDVSEWPLLIRDGIEPFATHGLPDPGHWVIVAAIDEGRILGVSMLVEQVHNHWSIASDARRSPTLVSGLWQATKQVLDEAGASVLHVTVSDEQPEVQAMVERLGYTPADGTLYILDTSTCLLNERAS